MNFLYALTATSDTTFFEDVWNYLYDVYLRVDGNYQNLGFDKSPLFSLRLLVLGLFVGGIIACIATAYHKQVLGGIARKLIEMSCISPESAKTAEELGYPKNPLVKNALLRSTSLRRVVRCVEEDAFYADQRADREAYEKKRAENKELPRFKEREYIGDSKTDHYYIPEELRIRAEIKFEKKGSGWVSAVISVVLMLILFFIVLLVLPSVLQLVDNFLGNM